MAKIFFGKQIRPLLLLAMQDDHHHATLFPPPHAKFTTSRSCHGKIQATIKNLHSYNNQYGDFWR